MKALGIALALVGVGVAGYGGYRYYNQRKGLAGLGTSFEDHNTKVAQSYWQRQAQKQQEIRERQIEAIANQRRG